MIMSWLLWCVLGPKGLAVLVIAMASAVFGSWLTEKAIDTVETIREQDDDQVMLSEMPAPHEEVDDADR